MVARHEMPGARQTRPRPVGNGVNGTGLANNLAVA